MARGIGISGQLPPTSCCDGSDDTVGCQNEVGGLVRARDAYRNSPAATVRAGAHLPDEMGAFTLHSRQRPYPAPRGPALRGHIRSIPGREHPLGRLGIRR
jgi:hypothetical protein